ncbi:aspartate:alanine exchanger family transporter [Shimia haliotis]|uniref:Putative transport protein n=1 Tax=Shimia haliotis TaxID=1280847 RepID=A0A1I4HL07_9RHOB|nr:transporter [Shimia haliotis]SFL42919.1 putative transport protein [Shimia haliotis]
MLRLVQFCGRTLPAMFIMLMLSAIASTAQEPVPDSVGGAALQIFEPVLESGIHGFFELLDKQPFVFLLLALAIGYPLGRVAIAGISLGPTAGTLLTGIVISLTAKVAFDIQYEIPGLVSTIFLLFFMYALGLKVGPQFFAGLRSGGLAFITIAVVVWALNWIIAFGGAQIAGLDPGYAPGIISGSYTITAVIGVATSAVQSGAYVPPEGLTAEQIGANMAAGYAISYVLSSVGIILLIRYLPSLFGYDAKAEAAKAEESMSDGATEPVPGAAESLTLGFSPYDIRAYRVEHTALIGKSVEALHHAHPNAPILRVLRGGQVIEPEVDPIIEAGDIVAVRADVHGLILQGEEVIGPEVDIAVARDVALEVADVHVGSRDIAGKTLGQLGEDIGYGLQLKALFRHGEQIAAGANTVIQRGDVARLVGPKWAVDRVGVKVGGKPIVETTLTEVTWMAIAMMVGYLVGIISVSVGGIPFALGTSAGCLLAGIFVSYFRSMNPEIGGPVSEGARSFLQDIGLNMFVAVLAANVGPQILQSFQGATVIWIALIGSTAALLPPFIGFLIGVKVFRLNPILSDGAAAGARNSTPGLNAIVAESGSAVAAVPYPLTYAVTTVLALIGGYVAMILS